MKMDGTMIEVENLCYKYPDGNEALSGVSFKITKGEAAAVVGPNGAGKTTLLLHLNGILAPSAGTVRIGGVKIAKENIPTVRRLVGLVFQNPDDQLFLPTLSDDVAFGPRNFGQSEEEVKKSVAEALQTVGLEGKGERRPMHLSLGEKKRASLATVLACQPPIIVFDEPTANLDPAGRRQIIQLLNRLKATLLLTTHDLDLVRQVCSRVLILDDGRLHADGETDKILNDQELLNLHSLR